MASFSNKKIVLGVSGGIACYKAAELVRLLVAQGAQVQVVMTKGAEAFIQPLTFQALTGNVPRIDLFDLHAEAGMGHIELARWADCILIAPATAQIIAKIAHGFSDDLLSTLILAAKAPLFIAPAMNQGMWHNSATQKNIQTLQQLNVHILGPGEGEQACGDIGFGRMLEPITIIHELEAFFASSQPLKGKKVVITAGPTREPIDLVRFISNQSSGKMGYALAKTALLMGAEVVLISGPVALDAPSGAHFFAVETAEQMLDAVLREIPGADFYIGAAAVSDFRPEFSFQEKKEKGTFNNTITLLPNPDILQTVANSPNRPKCVVGFAAQSHDVEKIARQKKQNKKVDFIIANQIGVPNKGFNSDTNECLVIGPKHDEWLPIAPKSIISAQIWSILCKDGTRMFGEKPSKE